MINAVDCAVPHPGEYPGWASVVLGYVGGHTLYEWQPSDINDVLNTARKWWGIWTARNHEPGNPPLTQNDGMIDSAGMIARLPELNYSKLSPVFYDIEPTIFDLDPTGANAAIEAWKIAMVKAGYLHVYSYTVLRQGGDWVANPTGVKPNSIPSGKIGVQYGGDANFDYDVFLDSLIPTPPKGPKMFGYLIFEPVPNAPRYWVVALDFRHKIQIDAVTWNNLLKTGNYLNNPGEDEPVLAATPDITVR